MGMDLVSDINEGYKTAMNYDYIDRFIVKVGWAHLLVIIVLIFTNAVFKMAEHIPNPYSWRVISIPEAVGAGIIALAASLIMALFRGRLKNHYLLRILVMFCLTLYSYVLVFLSGGAIEMHFHFFIMAMLLCVYSDWRLGWFLLVLTGLHHAILNYVAPSWVYFYGRNDFSLVAHAVPVLVAVIFTTMICENNRKAIISIMLKQKG